MNEWDIIFIICVVSCFISSTLLDHQPRMSLWNSAYVKNNITEQTVEQKRKKETEQTRQWAYRTSWVKIWSKNINVHVIELIYIRNLLKGTKMGFVKHKISNFDININQFKCFFLYFLEIKKNKKFSFLNSWFFN